MEFTSTSAPDKHKSMSKNPPSQHQETSLHVSQGRSRLASILRPITSGLGNNCGKFVQNQLQSSQATCSISIQVWALNAINAIYLILAVSAASVKGERAREPIPPNTVRLPPMIAGVGRTWAKFPCRNAFVPIDYRASIWGASTSFSRPSSCSAGSVARNATAIPFVLQANVAK